MDQNNQPKAGCGYKNGSLPSCAPLAVGFVPQQCESEPQYEADKALARGTLFPGLDLPLLNIVNTGTADVPAAELMALDFVAHDLSLYLDTHPDDKEAFAMYRQMLRMAEKGRREYERRYGPITKDAMVNAESYTWPETPWPWDSAVKRED